MQPNPYHRNKRVGLEELLIIVIGFLAGMIPAMLFVGFIGGRQVEKHRRELQLKYDRQITALRATLRRLMQRIDTLTGERNKLIKENKGLHDVLTEHRQIANSTETEFEKSRADLIELKQQVEKLTNTTLRYEGRLEESRINQDRMSAQLQQTISEFSEAERLRRHLLFATKQLRQTRTPAATVNPEQSKNPIIAAQSSVKSPNEMDISIIQVIEPLYVKRLHESGIHTVSDLAGQTPARVAHFAGLANPDDSKEWIAQAIAMINRSPHTSA